IPTATSVSLDTAGVWNITFTGALAGQNLNELTTDPSQLFSASGSGLIPAAEVNTIQDGAGHNDTNEVQLLSTGGATGSFSLDFAGLSTGTLSVGATAGQVQSALASLPMVGANNVTVSSSTPGNYTVIFQGALGAANQPQITFDPSSNLNGGSPTQTTLADGGGWDAVQQFTNTATVGSFVISFNGNISPFIPFNANAATIQQALESPQLGIGQGNISVIPSPTANTYIVTFEGALAGVNIPPLQLFIGLATINATVTAQGGSDSQVEVVNLAGATGGNFQLTYGGQTTASLAFNSTPAQVQAALAALPNIGLDGTFTFGDPDPHRGLPNVNVTNPTAGVFYVQFAGMLAGGPQGQIGINPTDSGAGDGLLLFPNVPMSDVTVATTSTGGLTDAIVTPANLILVNGATSSAQVTSGSNLLTVPANIQANVFPGVSTSPGATISGNIALLAPYATAAVTRNITLTDSPAANDLTITANIVDGAPFPVTLNKTGTGIGAGGTTNASRVVLNPTASNTYTGTTTITSGIITADQSSSLGASLPLAGGTNVQTLTITATGGTFQLSFQGLSTPALPFNITPAALQTAIESISGIPANAVTVTGSTGVYTITFSGPLLGVPNALIAVSNGGTLAPGNAFTLVNNVSVPANITV